MYYSIYNGYNIYVHTYKYVGSLYKQKHFIDFLKNLVFVHKRKKFIHTMSFIKTYKSI